MARQQAKPVPYNRGGHRVRDSDGQPGWRLRVWDARARRQQESVFYGPEQAAIVELAQRQDQVTVHAQPQPANAHLVTLEQWAVEWTKGYAYRVRPGGGQAGELRSRATWVGAKDVLSAYVLPALGAGTRMQMLTHDMLYNAIAGLRLADGSPASPATKEKTASVIRRMLREAVHAGVLSANPGADLPTTWGSPASRTVMPSLRQVEELAVGMGHAWEHHGNIIRFLAFTGLRWGELRQLIWGDVDLGRRTLRLRAGQPEARVRSVLLLDQAMGPLEQLRTYAEARKSDYVVCGARGGQLSYSLWRKHLALAQARSGVPYTARALRHVAAALLIASGATVEQVREQMGHSTAQVTQRKYRHAWLMDGLDLSRRLSQARTDLRVEDATTDADRADGSSAT